jgi:hypothetical protein
VVAVAGISPQFLDDPLAFHLGGSSSTMLLADSTVSVSVFQSIQLHYPFFFPYLSSFRLVRLSSYPLSEKCENAFWWSFFIAYIIHQQVAAASIDPGMYGEMSAEALVANARQEERNRQAFLQAREKSAANVTAFFADVVARRRT